MTERPTSQPRKRCTTAERNRTAAALSNALSEGQLTTDEFEERSTTCYCATFRDELTSLLEDLVDTPQQTVTGDTRPATAAPQAIYQNQPATPNAISRVTGAHTDKSFGLALFSGTTRTPAVVPGNYSNLAVFGGDDIVLTGSEFTAFETIINANACFGGTEIIVPEGFRIDVAGTGIFGGYDLKISHGATDPRALPPSAPLIRIIGVALFGGVEVKVVPSRG